MTLHRALASVIMLLAAQFAPATPAWAEAAETVASKKFTESVILGEVARLALQREGIAAEHLRELGGSRIVFEALEGGEVDIYPEYTGTLRYELLSGEQIADDAALKAALARHGLAMSKPLGFNNGYAIAMRRQVAQRLGIRTISDLARHPDLRAGVSNEFLDRKDGWRALSATYGLGRLHARGMDHDLAYHALAAGQIDVTDGYATDAEIAANGFVVLEDDRAFFPRYDAVYLYRQDLRPKARAAIDALAGTIDIAAMRSLNRMVRIDGMSETAAARKALGIRAPAEDDTSDGFWQRLVQRTGEHLALVGIALGAALIVAVPVGVIAARFPRFGTVLIPATGLLQTLPSLALFVMLIPLLGIGAAPTIAALFLYSLLPIVRNTYAGLAGIPPSLLDSAEALGLSSWTRLRRIELPLALPTILAGLRTAAIIAVGLATLGAIIGAGGYGQPILTGIRLANNRLVLEGAIPAAVMALAFEGMFHVIERVLTPRGLRRKASRGR